MSVCERPGAGAGQSVRASPLCDAGAGDELETRRRGVARKCQQPRRTSSSRSYVPRHSRHSPLPPSGSFLRAVELLRSVRTLIPSSSDAFVRLPRDTSSARSINFASASLTLSDVSTTAPSGTASVVGRRGAPVGAVPINAASRPADARRRRSAPRAAQPEALAVERVHWNHRVARENHRALHRVLQLADVARPLVTLQQVDRLRRDAVDLLADLLRVVRRESVGEQRNVVAAARAAAGAGPE